MMVCGWTFCLSHAQFMVWHVSSPQRHVSGGIWRRYLSARGGSKYTLRGTIWSVNWLVDKLIWLFGFGFSICLRWTSVLLQRQNDGFSSWQRVVACDESLTDEFVFGVEYNWIRPMSWSIEYHPIVCKLCSRASTVKLRWIQSKNDMESVESKNFRCSQLAYY